MLKKILRFINNKWVRIVGVLALISGIVFMAWSLIPLNPDQSSLDLVLNDSQLEVIDKPDYIVLSAKKSVAKIGLIFYPGAKVDSRAYLYKFAALAKQENVIIYITKPWLKYAFTDINGAKKVIDENKNIQTWILGGHSLGGAMACEYTKNHADIKYLILIGSFCSADISGTDKSVLSINGSEDGLIDSKKLDQYKKNVPKSARFEVVEGMNHAQAGNYGEQLGDKLATSPDIFTRLRITTIINNYIFAR
jgi:hypothetical protein